MDHPLPWLRYVDAGDLDDSAITLDAMKVESGSGEDLGTVDGFIAPIASTRQRGRWPGRRGASEILHRSS